MLPRAMLKQPIMNPGPLRHGDKVWVRGQTPGVERHYLIVDLRRRALLHNTLGGVQYAKPGEFTGVEFFVEQRAPVGYEDVIVERARALIGTQYDLLLFNCEHFVNVVHDGKKQSPQLQRATLWGTLIVGGIALLSQSNTGTNSAGRKYDKRTGRFV